MNVGFAPVDIYEDEGYLYLSNFCDKYVSIINLESLNEENRYEINGMPP